jgi:CRP-like cAMP-binding protein
MLAKVMTALRANPLFRGIGESRLKVVALSGEIQRLPAGETLFERGDEGDAAYLVLSGAVIVTIPTDSGVMTVARLEEGQLFGELAVLCDMPRTGGIVAEDEASILRLGAAEFKTLVAEFPELAMRLIRNLATRLERTSLELADARARARADGGA